MRMVFAQTRYYSDEFDRSGNCHLPLRLRETTRAVLIWNNESFY
jgi:hypothetical protein